MPARLVAAPASKPIISLPRGADPGLETVRIFLEVSRSEAGCVLCNRVIPKGVSRFSIVVRLAEPIVNKSGQRRLNERYNIHTGCLTNRLEGKAGQEVARSGRSCYDCGFEPEPPPETRDDGGATIVFSAMYQEWAFTTSKFAPAPLCDACAAKPKWVRCGHCSIHYPPAMIGQVEGDDGQTFEACVHCCQRKGWVTINEVVDAKAEWEQRRDDILKYGVFEAGDDPE